MPSQLLMVVKKDERGITGLETAIKVTAFVLVVAVIASIALSGGLFSTQKGQEAAYARLEEGRSTLEPRGSVFGSVLYKLDDCEDAWTAGINVSAIRDSTSYVEGIASASFAVAASSASGMVGYHDITSGASALDLSGCSRITLWIKSDTNLNDGALSLLLSESNDGTGAMESLAIPGGALDGLSWHKVAVSLSGATENYDAVKSEALYAGSELGRANIWLDIIETQPVLRTGKPMKARAGEVVFTVVGNGLGDSQPANL